MWYKTSLETIYTWDILTLNFIQQWLKTIHTFNRKNYLQWNEINSATFGHWSVCNCWQNPHLLSGGCLDGNFTLLILFKVWGQKEILDSSNKLLHDKSSCFRTVELRGDSTKLCSRRWIWDLCYFRCY